MLRIKPHHFLDILRDYGAGRVWEPHPYGHALHTVARSLLDNRGQPLTLVLDADDICHPCQKNDNGTCADWTESPGYRIRKEDWNRRIDQRILKLFELAEGTVISAVDLARLALRHLSDISTVWREAPKERTQERVRNLSCGLSAYLSGAEESNRK
jgi:hypothetical protein